MENLVLRGSEAGPREAGTGTPVDPSASPGVCCGEAAAETERRSRMATVLGGGRRVPEAWMTGWVGAGIRSELAVEETMMDGSVTAAACGGF